MRLVVGSLIFAGAALLLSPGPALAVPADDPVDLQGAYVLDAVGALDGRTSEVQAALDKLYDDTGAQAFVVYVDTFDNPSDEEAWAEQTATESGLGDTDLLLAIATGDRVYAYWKGVDSPVSDAQLEKVIANDLIPELRDSNWADAGVAFADGLNGALQPSPAPAIIGGIAVGGAATIGVVAAVRSHRKKKKVKDAAAAEAAALDQKAGTLLVQLDDALKTSEQELGFAQAQFGEDQTKDFAAALEQAQGIAKQAFEIQQKLDDAFPETPEEHRRLTEQLIQHAEQADEVLEAQQKAFDDLRQLEKNAPDVLDKVEAQQDGLGERIDDAEKTIADLKKTYRDGDLSSLAGLPTQARKLDRFADKTVADARAAIAAAKGSEQPAVAVAVRAAQQAVGQVEQLLASVDRTKDDLEAKAKQDAAAAAALDSQLRDARSRVQEANDYISTHRGAIGTTARTRASEASRHLDQAVAAGDDPDTAMSESKDAERMAAIALDLAMSDVENAENALASPQNHVNYDDGDDGAILGGILGGLFGDGGSSSSSSSGSSWWGGSSGSSSGWSSSGFGGSSSHHSSGGGFFGGGGGHSSGGSSHHSSGSTGHGRF